MSLRVVVVGGGIAGVSAAAELAAEVVPAGGTVTLVEAEDTLAHHTTGRSAAMYLPGYGNAIVRALTAASHHDLVALGEEVEAPTLSPKPMLWVADEDVLDHLATISAGNEVLEPIDTAGAIARCPVLRPERVAAGLADDDASEMDVGVLHQGYVRRLRRSGGTIEPGVRVDAIDRPGPAEGGGGWRVGAGERSWTADVLVDAAGAWADEVAVLAGVAPVGLQPMRRTLLTSPVAAGTAPTPLVADAAERWYFRVDPGAVLISPADETPSPPCDARPEDVDIALALEAVDAATTLGLRSVRSAWAGLRTFAPDRSPVLGPDPDVPDFVWSAGQGGYGIQMAPALARTVASLTLAGAVPDDVPLVGDQVTAARFRRRSD